MLAASRPDVPEGEGWIYEPKWDGFRAIAGRDGTHLYLTSRDGRNLVRYFPELVDALLRSLADGAVVDGEVICFRNGSLAFDTLLQRIHPAASRVKMLASSTPSSFVAFDLLASEGQDLTGQRLDERLESLDQLLELQDVVAALADPDRDPPQGQGDTIVSLTPRTKDAGVAVRWLHDLETRGLDGIVAKQSDLIYSPGKRTMVKVKRRRTADCVVGGYRLNKKGDGVGSLLLGFYDDAGVLQYVGHTSSFKAAERRELLARLRRIEGGPSFGHGRSPGGPSRWSAGKETSWFPVEPSMVCEVAFDRMLGGRFRHGSTFVRWREERNPKDCRFDQVEIGRG
jgi:ATP-dependent DNA ligase